MGLQRSTWKGCCGFTLLSYVRSLIRMSPKAKAASRGSAAAQTEGAPRLMQGMEQAMDVQLADVHCDQQHPNERVAPPGCAPGGARHSSRHVDRAHGSRHSTADAD